MVRRQRSGPPASPGDAGVYWSVRLRSGEPLSPREEAVFRAWMQADPAHAAAFAAADDPVEAVGLAAADPDMLEMRRAALERFPPRRSPVTKALIALAAAFGLMGVLAYAVLVLLTAPAYPVVTRERDGAAPPHRYAAAIGEPEIIHLADGSTVALNSGARIEVAYSDQIRGVRLLQGQALFEVAKHQARPFVVSAGGREIVATGTAFDVRLDDDQVKVVLIEGGVTVTPTARRGAARLLPALAAERLKTGEQLVARPPGDVMIAAADVERAISWRQGQVIFRADTLAAAVAEMNRYTDRQIVIEDPRVAALRISGVFRVSRPENFEAALVARYPVRIEQRSDAVGVLTWDRTG